MLDNILTQIEDLDPAEIIQRFDADFDTQGRAAQAVGLLRMRGAFASDETGSGLAVRLGASWCELIRADVQFDLATALSVIDDYKTDAARMAADGPGSPFAAYCLARWYDGSGKVLYRIGSHARGRMNFALATATARAHGLWWCRSDLESNWLRGRLEEARQAGATTLAADVLDDLEAAVARSGEEAAKRGVVLDPRPVRADGVPEREHMRGHSSLLHNLSFAIRRSDPQLSLTHSRKAARISEVLRDDYRRAQALNHQALVLKDLPDPDGRGRQEADRLFSVVQRLDWQRGRLIARQQLAQGHDSLAGARALADLLSELDRGTGRLGRAAGLDVDLRWFTVDAFETLATRAVRAQPKNPEANRLLEQAGKAKLATARSVRRVIALPAYKRAYGTMVRPVYLDRIGRALEATAADGTSVAETREIALSLVEESSGRELLDLISSADLPTLTAPPTTADIARASAGARAAAASVAGGSVAGASREPPVASAASPHEASAAASAEPVSEQAPATRRRRAPEQHPSREQIELDRAVLMDREREFEQQFLTRPLQAAPHDEEIARRATMFVANHPGTRFIRYFARGWFDGKPEELGAFVIGETISEPITLGPYRTGSDLVTRLLADEGPSPELCAAIWKDLLAPLFPLLGDDLRHLVLVPTDDLFAVPLHLAAPADGSGALGVPLGARVPLSQTVSLTAFLTRGRNLLRRQLTAQDDDLSAVVLQDGITAAELVETGWDAAHVHIAGDIPTGLTPGFETADADWAGVQKVTACRPEFFVYAGHGSYVPGQEGYGPYLQLRGANGSFEHLTPYDIALRVRLPRNVLTLIGACLAGQGANTPGGDVAGFLRSFMAAGAGAIGLPLWPVEDEYMAETGRHLLRASRPPTGSTTQVFDVVTALYEHYRQIAKAPSWWVRMPLALYT
jgi:hypothetical protein